MTSSEAYKNFLIKFNKNDSNRNISIPKGQFILIYNEQAEIWEDQRIERGLSSDNIDDIAELLVLDKELNISEEFKDFYNFKLPEDYFRYSNSYSIASKEGCSSSVIYNFDVKNKNKNELLLNEHEEPSFEYETTFAIPNDKSIAIYRTDFTIDKVFIDYYRLPKKIDVGGYIKVDGSHSQNINPDLSDKLVSEIIDYTVKEAQRIYENPQGFELANERIKK